MSSGPNTANDRQGELISALSHDAAYPHNTIDIQLIETHISWVFLTGQFAYKIKKPVNFGFLDFSTLEKRRHYCEEELRLNRRLAASLYLEVVPISGPAEKATISGDGEAVEYAVKMLQFDVGNTFDQLLLHGKLKSAHIAEAAEVLAAFHKNISTAEQTSSFGTAEAIRQPAMENFDQLSASLQKIKNQNTLSDEFQTLHEWTTTTHQTLIPVFEQRKDFSFIRECHGDLHLRNITLWENHVTPFDCIEFNDNLRWIDVISELAFLLMDLDDHQQAVISRQLLNHYLSLTGDYDGLQVLRYYQVYRAMVRAKVAGLRLTQNKDETPQQLEEIRNYLRLAERYTKPCSPTLYITHGLSGSGKTQLSKKLSLAADIIHLRSDVERKRFFGLDENTKTGSKPNEGIYTQEITQKTYQQLLLLSRTILSSGFSVLVDATFLQRQQRDIFKSLAKELGVSFTILHCEVDNEILRQRIQQRLSEGKDASEADEAVLEKQQEKQESLDDDEIHYTQHIHATCKFDIQQLLHI